MRISTSSILRNYNTNLSKSMANLEASRTRVATKRNFNKVSESPAGATKSFQLRRDFIRNEDHLENIKMAQAKFTSIESGISQVSKMAETIHADILTGINGTTSKEQREAIAQGFDKMKESMVLSLNAKDGDKYVFGGTNTTHVPFKLEGNDLYYFVKEDATNGPVYINVQTGDAKDKNGIIYKADGTGTDPNKNISDLKILNDAGTANIVDGQELLKHLASEKLYLDTGFGLQMDANNKVVEGTALNISYPSIDLVGFGEAGGVSNNLITVVGQLAKEFRNEPMDQAKVQELTKAFDKARNGVLDKWTSVGTLSSFLEKTEDRLIDNRINLNTKIVDIENVNMEQAITEFEFAKYAYNAALKVGMSILQPSFIDFMK